MYGLYSAFGVRMTALELALRMDACKVSTYHLSRALEESHHYLLD